MKLSPEQMIIAEAWRDNEELYGDKSTEFLLQLTADMCGCETSDVIDAVFLPEEGSHSLES